VLGCVSLMTTFLKRRADYKQVVFRTFTLRKGYIDYLRMVTDVPLTSPLINGWAVK
jgi:hypothetical protein